MSDQRTSAAKPASRSRLRAVLWRAILWRYCLGRELERPAGSRRQRYDGEHGVDVQRPVDMRERQLRAWHVVVAHLGTDQASVDDEQQQVPGHVPVILVSGAGDLRLLGGVDEP